ncbi:hypothetical protein [Saliphagus sp. LR7]|uniref:DUF7109 family protein n=1 Tax=Saliphagus sp. LR7 TaxID=2282654 RepID=UPI000DF75932|nr:hypothetical protein [Saliphagus sp. LR7]
MDVSADELAGVLELFGGLTRAELERALSEAAARSGAPEPELGPALAAARRSFGVVVVTHDGTSLYVAGPTAFPTLPEGGEDLRHILSVDPRDVERAAAADAVRGRYDRAVRAAIRAGDGDRLRELLDTSYDVEAWAPADFEDERDRIEDALAGLEEDG